MNQYTKAYEERQHYERLARQIEQAHLLGLREQENQILPFRSFTDEDKRLVVKALEKAARR